jgi:hypothetical protein
MFQSVLQQTHTASSSLAGNTDSQLTEVPPLRPFSIQYILALVLGMEAKSVRVTGC